MSDLPRVLFPDTFEGAPSNPPESVTEWAARLNKASLEKMRNKWGFDFKRGEPTPRHDQYTWYHGSLRS